MVEIYFKLIGIACLYALGFGVIIILVLLFSAILNRIDEWKREREINYYLDVHEDRIKEEFLNPKQPTNNKSFDDVLNDSLQNNNIRRI